MAGYQLISFKLCPWVQRAAIVLREKGVEFEFIHIEGDNRPDWFKPISPHGKVPVLRIGDDAVLFESNAIAEYLDEVQEPRLHPADPIKRAINRAWTDYLPAFAGAAGAVSAAKDEEAYRKAIDSLRVALGRLEEAASDAGPYFNGPDYALVDAAYAPFLQRWRIAEQLAGEAILADFPKVARWTAALIARPSTHTFPPAEFDAQYGSMLQRRGGYATTRQAVPA